METAKYTLLLVDDEPGQLRLLHDTLRKNMPWCQLLMAPHGIAALDVLETNTPDLVITDWQMPGLDGIGLLKTIRSMPSLATVAVIVVTGKNIAPENLQRAFDAGASDYLSKPFAPIELQTRINAVLQTREALHRTEAQRRTIQEQKKRESLHTITEIDEKNLLLANIKKQLEQMMLRTNDASRQRLGTITKKIQHNLHFNNTFRKHFEQVHPLFFEALLQHTPQLSSIDLRHCAYVKLGLSHDEIAQILGVSLESVARQHHRIKQKMHQHTGDSLGEILLKLVPPS